MNLSPERQAEYDAMGLPWLCDQSNGIYCYNGEWDDEITLFDPITDSVEVMEFANLAANAYHANQQTIEVLTTKVEQLKGLLYYASQWIDYEDPVDRVCFEALDSQIKAALNPKEKI